MSTQSVDDEKVELLQLMADANASHSAPSDNEAQPADIHSEYNRNQSAESDDEAQAAQQQPAEQQQQRNMYQNFYDDIFGALLRIWHRKICAFFLIFDAFCNA
eukprot:CAMPEP_0202696378 /NCGR_PEP_ID=MMETSP1385-20130828/9672_1 /ASSEMBLY_ACC=CAM_ASM_000861 /TAXON_ID=933848 /ORGANISM="Elphidium margaritaceum" /LENGTH=102 /DNA_ID=CAMNT_0049352531 /DNA_START=24 /DNA_END=328 /DNA_ORIENTATION=-